jgi:uncharacterized protein YrrD
MTCQALVIVTWAIEPATRHRRTVITAIAANGDGEVANMMVSYKQLRGFSVKAKDGTVGRVKDVYFDDGDWSIRYIVDENGAGAHRDTLVNREWITGADPGEMQLELSASTQQLNLKRKAGDSHVLAKDAPKKPTSQAAWDILLKQLFPASYPDSLSGETRMPMPTPFLVEAEADKSFEKPASQSNLQSAADVIGFRVSTNDGKLGFVEDFIINSKNWEVSFLVINVARGLDGKRILVATEWVDWVSWKQRKISISADKETLQACPNFMLDIPLNPEDEPLLNETFECRQYQDRIGA